MELATYASVALLAPLGLMTMLMAVMCLFAIMGVVYFKPWSFIERLAGLVIVFVGAILAYCLVAALGSCSLSPLKNRRGSPGRGWLTKQRIICLSVE